MGKRIVAVLTIVALGLLATSPAQASPTGVTPPPEAYCGITWGSGAKAAGPSTSPFSPLTDIRTGRHACYDRMVFDLEGPAAGYRVQYVNHVYTVARGALLPLGGGARLEIVLRAPANDVHGHATYDGVEGARLPRVDLAGYRTFRNARYGGSFEGVTIIGLSTRARLPFRVVKLDHRLVLDVAHQW